MKKIHLILPAVLIVLTAGAAVAQDYPTKPINLIVPFAPGGASDVVARIISPLMSKELGQQIIVDNRAGASGNIGVAYAARASNDGYNVLLGNIGTMAINPALFKKFQVKPVRDFVAVTQVVDAPTALVLHPSIPARTVKEFIEYAKERPGKLNFGTAGPGSNGRLEMELFMDYTGIDLVQVPYKGGAGAAAEDAYTRVRDAVTRLRAVAADPRAELLVAGRTSAATIGWLEGATASRTRALIEERGLRTAMPDQRPPRSTLGLVLDREGPEALGRIVAGLADAAVIDSRVLLAHRLGADEGAWPPAEDRFASDLLLPDRIGDPWLRSLTTAA